MYPIYRYQPYSEEKQHSGPRSLQVPGVLPGDRSILGEQSLSGERPHTSGEAPSIALHVQNSLRK